MARRSPSNRRGPAELTGSIAAEPDAADRRIAIALSLTLVALSFIAYWPALRGGFVWDDDAYLTRNPHMLDAGGLREIWFQIGATKMFVPLVFTTLWIEHRLWGLEPFGYHAVNIALHGLGAVLFWRLLRRLAVPGAWLGAAIFAVHPV